MLREPATLFPDDKLYVDCHFDNTAEHQIIVNDVRLPPRNVAWVEKKRPMRCADATYSLSQRRRLRLQRVSSRPLPTRLSIR